MRTGSHDQVVEGRRSGLKQQHTPGKKSGFFEFLHRDFLGVLTGLLDFPPHVEGFFISSTKRTRARRGIRLWLEDFFFFLGGEEDAGFVVETSRCCEASLC